MKKLAVLFASALAVLTSEAALAQNLTLTVQNDTVWFGPKALSYDDVGVLVEEKAPQTVFVYVDYKTPFVQCHDIQNAIAMCSTSEVLFLNPDRYTDKGRDYGPVMASHANFEDWGLYDEAKKRGSVLELKVPLDDPVKQLQKKEYTAVLFELDRNSTVGDVYGFINKVEDICPNIVIKVPEGDYSRGGYIHVFETDPQEYEFETYPCIMGQAWVVYRGSELLDPQDFAEKLVAFESVTKITVPGAHPGKGRAVVEMTVTPLGTLQDVKIVRPSPLPGLDDVIIKALYAAPAWWVPQFKKDAPINVKITVPVEGEIGAY